MNAFKLRLAKKHRIVGNTKEEIRSRLSLATWYLSFYLSVKRTVGASIFMILALQTVESLVMDAGTASFTRLHCTSRREDSQYTAPGVTVMA